MLNMFFKSTAPKGREYSHWIDLTLNSHCEAVMSEIYRTKACFVPTSTCFLRLTKKQKRYKKVQQPQNRDDDATLAFLGGLGQWPNCEDLRNIEIPTPPAPLQLEAVWQI